MGIVLVADLAALIARGVAGTSMSASQTSAQPGFRTGQTLSPLGVNRITLKARRELLLLPDQRTSPTGCVRSEKCRVEMWRGGVR